MLKVILIEALHEKGSEKPAYVKAGLTRCVGRRYSALVRYPMLTVNEFALHQAE